MNYTIFTVATGEIRAWGSVPAGTVSQQLREGEDWIEGQYSSQSHYIDGVTPTEKPARPAPGYNWDVATKAWVLDLDAAKAAKWEEMKKAREQALSQPLATPYGTFDADADSRAYIINTAHLMQTMAQELMPGDMPTEDFTLADNTVVTLTAAAMVDVALLLASQIKDAFARAREVRPQIEAATTVAELDAIAW